MPQLRSPADDTARRRGACNGTACGGSAWGGAAWGAIARGHAARWVVATAALLAGGCQTYTPLPLTDAAVERALRPPSTQAMQHQAEALRNTRLAGVRIDPSDGLSPDEAAVIAVLANPTLRAARDFRLLADAQVIAAGILPNPTLSYNLDIPLGSNTGGAVSGYGLGVDWDFTALIARPAKIDAAKSARRQIVLDIAWQEWQVAQAARQACYDVASLRRQLADATDLSRQIGGVADKFNAALSRNDVTAAEANAARAAADEARLTVAITTRDLRDATLALNAALGLAPQTQLEVARDVTSPDEIPPPDIDALTAAVAGRRLDLIALRRGYDAQEATVRAAVLAQFPRITLGLANTRDFGDFLTLGPTATADLPFFDRNQGVIAAERATRQRLFDEYVVRLFQARSDIARAAAMIGSLNQIIVVQRAQVATLQQVFKLNQRALNEGGISLSTFYVATIDLATKQADLNRYRQELMRAEIALELAAGIYEAAPAVAPGTAPAVAPGAAPAALTIPASNSVGTSTSTSTSASTLQSTSTRPPTAATRPTTTP